MPCMTQANLTPTAAQNMRAAVARLEGSLRAGTVSIVVGRNGAIAFRGWVDPERGPVSDLCAFRKLQSDNSAPLRMALARAEALAGRKADPRAVAAGTHSHDGGTTWHSGH